MRNTLLATTLLFIHLNISAQQAPDFTVTDTDGQVHHLYADYLNQGKSVMIKIFFTTCPPCNSIAPLMEPFYQEWGAGEYDVEFFELSDKNFDTDALVEAYAANYGETFPAAGFQGGSIAAVQPYKNGSFGPWYGTPTFVVIAPDGSVQYNVDGPNNQATIDAIDAALTATGAEKPGAPDPIAPDFSVMDTDDQLHHLYSDYLDQGKTILIEVFNTASSPSHTIAPLLQPLYEEWGGGDGDVEFFLMSNQGSDNDADVFEFQLDYNQTFPGISNDGGSVPAVQVYQNGTFGPWTQTPTFVVIAPDGTVQYNIDGPNDPATIEEIDEAITLTGAVKPAPPTTAPDFTVTDTDGQVHHLYEDYLNQGKTVLIEVFYTTCPPCNSIAPLMEPLYQEWGAGEYDVEFFEMSDKNFDTDALVEAYQDNYNETFIGISKDGGSLAAVQPYKNGSFGPWSGTPTFIVIAPDGTVQYDVYGPNNQATIDSIEFALAATGAEKPLIEPPLTITGRVYFNGTTTGVGNAMVQIVDDSLLEVVLEAVTDPSGLFSMEFQLSDVQPTWKLRAIKKINPTNGLNALDLVRIQKHILFVDPFDDPFSKLAADANRSGSISTLDLATLIRLLLGVIPNFPDQHSWIIFPADTDFGTPTFHPPVINSYTIPVQDILDGLRQPNFIGVKKGDANGNANPNQ